MDGEVLDMEEVELARRIAEGGKRLLHPPVDVDQLMDVLDQVKSSLALVEQSPTKCILDALEPARQALIAEELLRHVDKDVKVAVASCISEITRITAPETPYDDELMKEIFIVTVSAFEDLSDMSSRSYHTRVSILETVAKVRSCVVMLDLECDDLILAMFQHFFKSIRDDHPDNVFLSMHTIMTLVLEDSEEITPEMLDCLLKIVKKEVEVVSPIAQKLGVKVISSCAERIRPYVLENVKSKLISLDEYDRVVASLCHETSDALERNGSDVYDKDNVSDLSPKVDGNKSLHDTEKTVPDGPGVNRPVRKTQLRSKIAEVEGYHTPKRKGRKPKFTPAEAAGDVQIDSKKESLDSVKQKDTNAIAKSSRAKAKAALSDHEEKLDVASRSKSNRRKPRKFDLSDSPPSSKRSRFGKKTSNGEVQVEKNKRKKPLVDNDLDFKSDDSKTTSLNTILKGSRTSKENSSIKESTSAKEVIRRKGITLTSKQESKGSEKKKKDSGKKTAKVDVDKSSQEKEKQKILKRKRTNDKINKVAIDENLVGSKIEVYWPEDEMYYRGVVDSFDPIKKEHRILYSDGDEEILQLRKEDWRFIDGGNDSDKEQETPKRHKSSDREQETPKRHKSSDMPPKKNIKAGSESSKRERNEETPKRGISSRSKSSDIISAKLGGKLKGSSAEKGGKKPSDEKSKTSLKQKDDSPPLSATLKSTRRLKKSSLKFDGKAKDMSKSGQKSGGKDSKTVLKLDPNGDASDKSKSTTPPKGRKTKDEESPAKKNEESPKGKRITENAQGNGEKSEKKRKKAQI